MHNNGLGELIPLTAEQCSDLRKQVLSGKQLDLETAREVIAYLRNSRVSAAEAANVSKKSRKKGMTDAQLDADLDDFLGATTGAESEPDLIGVSRLYIPGVD